MTVTVKAFGAKALLSAPLTGDNLRILKGIPSAARWQGAKLVFEPTPDALKYVEKAWPKVEWSDDMRPALDTAIYLDLNKSDVPQPANLPDFAFKTTPFAHQLRVFKTSRDAEAFALFMEQGTGKSKVAIDTAAWLWSQGRIDFVLVIAPNGVHRNWVDNEFPAHMPDFVNYKAAFWKAPSSASKAHAARWSATTGHDGLVILTVNVEALSHEHTLKVFQSLLKKRKALVIVDESTRIKDRKSSRTKAAIKLGRLGEYRRILTGTPVTQGPLDLYSQFEFLDPDILGFENYSSFERTYAIMNVVNGAFYDAWERDEKTGRNVKVQKPVETVVGYQHTEDLQRRIEGHSFRVLKKDCLDLPDKVFRKWTVELTPQQRKLYAQFRDEMMAEFKGVVIPAPLALTRLLRFRQLLGGFLNDEPLDANPRLDDLMTWAEDLRTKAIVWASFKPELRAIAARLRERYGDDSVVEYHGDIGGNARAQALLSFQGSKESGYADHNPRCRFFVGHPVAGGIGLTLTHAKSVAYYNNDWSLEVRLQSEDRAHRIGQRDVVDYTDFYAPDTVEDRVIEALRGKRDLASQITGDELLSWI